MNPLSFVIGAIVIALSSGIGFSQEVWTRCTIPTVQAYSLKSVAFGNNTFVCVGDWGTILTSPDGTNWTVRKSGTDQNLAEVIWGNDQFLILEISNNEVFMTSKDGISWNFQSYKSDSIPWAVTWGRNRYVAVGDFGSTATSPDGIVWTKLKSVTDQVMTGVACDGNQFVAVGTSGKILISPDAFPWTTVPRVGNGYSLFGMVWGGNRFVAVGYKGTIIASPDGSNWTVSNSGTDIDLFALTWGDNQYIAVGRLGTIQASWDGATWVHQIPGVLTDLNSVAWGNGKFVAVGQDTTILCSPGVTQVRMIGSEGDLNLAIRINKSLISRIPPGFSSIHLKIFSLNGSLVREIQVNGYGHNNIALPPNISKGTYVVLLTAGKMRIEKRIVID